MDQTLLLIKPNATQKKLTGKILTIIEENGFAIKGIKSLQMDTNLASRFYEIHKQKAFFQLLLDFMTSGITIAVILEKENAITDLRTLVGDTNPDKANIGTIRYLYADSVTKNAVHASDSIDNANKEIKIIFN
ncbi:MAG: nucleoside-diphosphate kinase [Candidatus Cloacimonetes bacterium]|jgi:nucleoside-diphosphate kinase|nr:nucleoside-diphosphate kinase [Candidatus Cloacimonadota bacterium]MDD4156545.1 nucleoside-diphosphate kinase [Candidatus Cloacimonadota bacterium]